MSKAKPTIVAPAWLCDAAKAEWARVVALPEMGFGAGDIAVLSAYCQNWARWVESERMLTENGCEVIIRDDKGAVKAAIPSPWIGIGTKAHDRMLKAAKELGLSSERPVAASTKRAPVALPESSESVASEWFGGGVN